MYNYEKHPMSVFAWTFTWRYALRHPIRIIRWYLDALRQRRQRAVYGWCMNDVNDWYNWTAYVLAGLLTEISENELIKPGRAAQLRSIADGLKNAIPDTADKSFNERKRAVEEKFDELGKIFFDFFN